MADIFEDAVNSVSYQLAGRDEVIEYYKDTYGAKGWQKQLVDDQMKLNPSAKRASLNREFQYDKRLGMERYKSPKTSKATQERYTAIGKTLPRIPHKDAITVTVKGTQRGETRVRKDGTRVQRKERDRTITVTLSGDKATQWINNPNYGDIWDEYGYSFDTGEEDGDYVLDVSSVTAA